MKKRLFVAAAATAAILGSYAQINSPSAEGYLSRAVSMYEDGNYFGCIDQLIKIDEAVLPAAEVERMRYYRALATVHTDKTEARKQLELFLAEYPESMHAADAQLALGDCFYGSDYEEALYIYRHIDITALSDRKKEDLRYRMAYCYLKLEQYEKSKDLFESLASSRAYGNAANFYLGYLAYVGGNYANAEKLLKSVDTSDAPGNMADFYLSQIYFMREDYSKALSTAKNLLKRSSIAPDFVAEANRVAGECSYQLGDDSQAITYLRKYINMVEVPKLSTMYILGLSAYHTGDYSEAIEYLNPVTEGDNAMGQSAYLYLGQAYMHEGDYSAAAMAFNRALNMTYDSNVRETAYYNYAVASVSGGKVPFASTIKVFTDFLRLYPDSQYAPDVQEYIITSYLTDENYTAALESINQMKSPSSTSLQAKQRVLYVLGTKALATGDYQQALTYLTEANTLAKYDKAIANEVSLALGEAYYRNGMYSQAAAEIQKYIKVAPKAENVPLAYYDLGYALYAQKKYNQAGSEFAKCVQNPGALTANVIADAYNRLGDCYYFDKDFVKAEDAYNKAYSRYPSAGDYALFQKALMAGYQRQHAQKIETLDRMQREFPTSALIPDAMLETTESYLQLGNSNKAIEVYRTLVSRYPNTAQGRQGYLQMALVKLNNGDRRGASEDYKEVIRRYPTSDEAKQAVDQMKRIAAEEGNLNSFIAWLNNISSAPQINATEAEQLTFESAEKEYLANQNLKKLEDFIDEYPESTNRARALSYLMEGEHAKGNDSAAYDYAVAIVEQYPSSGYAQGALTLKAETEEAEGKANLAMRTWRQLAQSASSAPTLLKARMGVIRNGRAGAQYDDVQEAAEAVMASSGVGTDDMAEAIYSRAWVLQEKGDQAGARTEWQKIADQTDLLYGIMSAYSLGESYLKSKSYSQAEKWAKAVTNAPSPHTYWIARGFILLSDVYEAQGDKYKARQYLEAVRDNYTGTESDIFEMIEQRLK